MTAVDGLRFSARALVGHRLRAALSLLGVAVGVTSVVLLTSLGEGALTYVTREFASLGSNLLIVLPGKTETSGFVPPMGGAPHDLTLDDADAIRRRAWPVTRVAPMTMGSATVKAGDLTRDVFVIGATTELKDVLAVNLAVGRFLPEGEPERGESVCVIGATIQDELFRGRSALGQRLRVGDERYRVIGIMAGTGTSLGMNLDDIVVVPIGRHMRMFDLTSVFRLFVEVKSHDDLTAGRDAVVAVITSRHDGEDDITVLTQDALLASFSRLLSILTMALTGIASISLSVAGIGIMNVMLVSVSERTREVGLLKAIGATPAQILLLFLAEAAMLSAAGGAVGLAAATALIAVAGDIYPAFPMRPPPWAPPAAVVVSLGVGVLFGVLPARRAARLEPIGALARR